MRSLRPADYPGCPATVAEAEAAGADLRPTGWGIGDAVITLVGSLAVGLVAAMVLLSAGVTRSQQPGLVLILGATVPWIALAGWPILVTRKLGNGPVIDLGLAVRRQDVGWGLVGGFVAFSAGAVVARLTELLIGTFDSAAGQAAERASAAARWQLVLFALVVSVAAPFVEEIAFRGLLWAGLARAGMRPVLTLITTTVVFALFHFEVRRLAVLLVIGLVLGFLRMRTGRLGASMIAHGLNNLPAALAIAVG